MKKKLNINNIFIVLLAPNKRRIQSRGEEALI